MELQHYFQNLGAKSPSSGQKFKPRQLENYLRYWKKNLFIVIFKQILLKKQIYIILKNMVTKKFKKF